MYWGLGLKHLFVIQNSTCNKQLRRVILRPETKKKCHVSATIALAYRFEATSKEAEERVTQMEPSELLDWGDEIDEPRWVKFIGQGIRVERAAPEQHLPFGGDILSFQLSTCKHEHERKLPETGKGPHKRIQCNSTQCSPRARENSCPHKPEWRTLEFLEHWVEYREGSYISSWEILALEWAHLGLTFYKKKHYLTLLNCFQVT